MTNIAFMASDAISIGAMDFLRASNDFNLVCVVSNPDKPRGRGHRLAPNDAAQWAIDNGVELLRPEKSPNSEIVERIKSLGADAAVVMAYGCILRDCVLDNILCLNIHASLLPEFRGASPIETAIALGRRETGVSLMRITKRMDEGPVCAVEKLSISPRETSRSLREKICMLSSRLLEKNLAAAIDGQIEFKEQNHSQATYTRKLEKSDLFLDFRMSAIELDRRIRAFGFGFAEIGGVQYKVGEAFATAEFTHSDNCGMILSASPSDGLNISCARGILRVERIQKPCAKMLSAKDFLAGTKISVGDFAKSFSNEPLLKNM